MRNDKAYNNLKWLFIVLLFIAGSCSQQKFDKDKWSEREDPAFPPSSRARMLDDLITNHDLVGLSYKDLVARLGMPDNKDEDIVTYKIVVEYGTDIDPVYTKDLVFTISKDSSITSMKVRDWKTENVK